MTDAYQYPGEELKLFEGATCWKKYFTKKIRPFIGNAVLEVGGGLGATSKILNDGSARSWVILEPDQSMFQRLVANHAAFAKNTSLRNGDINSAGDRFDTILYIDVLEHIERDHDELLAAAKRLEKNGRIIVLSPAFQKLFTPFDKAIGHYRRYTKSGLKKVAPSTLTPVYSRYLDSCGFFASVANKLFLHQSQPTLKQVRFWDRFLVPVSKITDPIFAYSFGKSILIVWEKE